MIEGTVLEPGRVLGPNDYYSSSSGKWEKCPSPGSKVVEGSNVVWIRLPELMTLPEALGEKKMPMFRDDSGCEFG